MSHQTQRHAYLVAAHNHPAQLLTLLRMLDDSENDLYVHVDRKASDISEDALRLAVANATIHFVERLDAGWGSERFIDVIVSLLEAATRVEHSYYHLVSGSDLPLKPQREIREFFATHAGREFVDLSAEEPDPALIHERLERFTVRRLNRSAHFTAPWRGAVRLEQLSNRLQDLVGVNRLRGCPTRFQKGSVWFSITHGLARFAVEHSAENRPHYRYSTCADEIWLQTLLLSSPFMENRYFMGYGDEGRATMRFIDWPAGSWSPRVLTSADYDAAMGSGLLFARKFDESVDPVVIERVSRTVGQPAG